MAEAKKLCGHINKHYYKDGKQVNLSCKLEKGHEGNHQNKSVVNGFWKNSAGKLAK